MLKLWKEHTLQIKTAQSLTYQFKNLLWTHKNWYITLHSVKAEYNFISVQPQNHSGWKRYQKVYSPTSCLYEGQPWGTTRSLRTLPHYILKPCKNDAAQSLWVCPVPLPKCPPEKGIGYNPIKGCNFFCLWPLSQKPAQTSQFPRCRHHVPVVRSSEAISAPGWIRPTSSASCSTDQFDQPHSGLHTRSCWISLLLLFTYTLLDGSHTLKHIEDLCWCCLPSPPPSWLDIDKVIEHGRTQDRPLQQCTCNWPPGRAQSLNFSLTTHSFHPSNSPLSSLECPNLDWRIQWQMVPLTVVMPFIVLPESNNPVYLSKEGRRVCQTWFILGKLMLAALSYLLYVPRNVL